MAIMAKRLLLLCMALLAIGTTSKSDEAGEQVLVELFTSQGCSSCPPADEFLHRIADRDDVIALSLHVDYWDYLGWRDRFGSAEHSERQRAYAAASDERMIYTPQIVVAGRERLVGSRGDEVLAAIERRLVEGADATISLALEDGEVHASIAPKPGGAVAGTVQLAWYTSSEHVTITEGENAGRDPVYRNVVHGWRPLGAWSGRAQSYSAPVPETADAVVVILQSEVGGPVLGARRIDVR